MGQDGGKLFSSLGDNTVLYRVFWFSGKSVDLYPGGTHFENRPVTGYGLHITFHATCLA